MRSFKLIWDIDGLRGMFRKEILNIVASNNKQKPIKVFMQVPWNLITEVEITPKQLKISPKEF
jgi:hypothetical protein